MNIFDYIALNIPVSVYNDRCIRCYSKKSTCIKCIQSCPTRGIVFNETGIDVTECIGCGRCIQQCPLHVFELDFQHIMDIDATSLIILSCYKSRLKDYPVIETRCLQQFNIYQLAVLLQKYSSIILFCDEETCEKCDSTWYPLEQKLLLEKNGLKKTSNNLSIIRNKKILDEFISKSDIDLNNRRLFMKNQWKNIKNTGNKYIEQTARSYIKSFSETVSSQKIVFKKTQAQTMILHQCLLENEDVSDEAISLQKLENSRCRFCVTCESMCPWGAIAIIREENNSLLVHHDVLCARCGICIDVCPENGLFWNQGLTVKDIYMPEWRVLKKGTKKQCNKCEEIFYTDKNEQELCVFCKEDY